ncbi:MAG: hypothetical protein WBY94_29840 [Polyangiaceae bacterium]
MTSKRNPEDIVALLEEGATDPEMDRVLALGETERRREVESAGARLAVLHAEADRMYTSFLQDEEDRTARMKHSHAQVRTPRKPVWQRRSAIVVAGFAAAACIALAATCFLWRSSVAGRASAGRPDIRPPLTDPPPP